MRQLCRAGLEHRLTVPVAHAGSIHVAVLRVAELGYVLVVGDHVV